MKTILYTLLIYVLAFLWLLPLFGPTFAIFDDPSMQGCGAGEQNTALGCIPVTADGSTVPVGLLTFLLRWVFGISGGIIILMLIVTGYTLATSAGNPEKLQAARENIVSIFSGLVLIVFSVILLKTIGADVLILPTFRYG